MIWYNPPAADLKQAYDQLTSTALSCFFEISDGEAFDVVQTPEGIDICCNNVELGSYGVRQMGPHTWIFGTGIAEPRFSLVVQRRLTLELIEQREAEERAEKKRQEEEAAAATVAEAVASEPTS